MIKNIGSKGLIEDDAISKFGDIFGKGDMSAKDFLQKTLGTTDMQKTLDQFSGNAKKSISLVWDEIEAGSAKASDVFAKNMNGSLVVVDQQLKQSKEKFHNFIGSFKDIGNAIGSTLVNAIASAGISFLVSQLISVAATVIDDIWHHSEKVIEKGKEA